jgi:hypothetical protein
LKELAVLNWSKETELATVHENLLLLEMKYQINISLFWDAISYSQVHRYQPAVFIFSDFGLLPQC